MKKASADRKDDDDAETLGCPATAVSVAIKEIPQDDWKEKVFDGQIMADKDSLYVEPGYTC